MPKKATARKRTSSATAAPRRAARATSHSPRRVVIGNAERRATTRATVLRAAAECFDEAGYLATRLDDVTTRANLTKGAVYFHFGSKEALAQALIDEQRDHWPAVVAQARARPGTPLDHLVELSYDIVDELRKSATLRAGIRLAFERDIPGADPAAVVAEWTRVAEGLLRRARRAGALAGDAVPAAVARVVVAYVIGAVDSAGVARGPGARKRLEDFWALTLPSLRPLRGRRHS